MVGGYIVVFKLAERKLYDELHNDIEALRRRAEVVGPQQLRNYTIDISYHEFCEGKVKREVDDYAVYVYSLEMIVAEKLRAICQQMPRIHGPFALKDRGRETFMIFIRLFHEHGIDLTTNQNQVDACCYLRCKAGSAETIGSNSISIEITTRRTRRRSKHQFLAHMKILIITSISSSRLVSSLEALWKK